MPADHCKHGHPWTEETTFVNVRGIRECRTCRRQTNAGWKQRNPLANRVYKAQPTSVTCPDCGAVREITRGRAGGVRTRRCLACAHKKGAEKLRTGRYVECKECGTPFWRVPSRALAARFCSRDCAYKNETHREKLRDREGNKNPRFSHGKRVGENIRGWSVALKEETCCRVCGSTYLLHLHHIIPRGKSRASRRDLRNGMTLCGSCHSRWHRRSLVIHRDLMTAEEWDYVSSVKLTGESTGAWLDRYYPAMSK